MSSFIQWNRKIYHHRHHHQFVTCGLASTWRLPHPRSTMITIKGRTPQALVLNMVKDVKYRKRSTGTTARNQPSTCIPSFASLEVWRSRCVCSPDKGACCFIDVSHLRRIHWDGWGQNRTDSNQWVQQVVVVSPPSLNWLIHKNQWQV